MSLSAFFTRSVSTQAHSRAFAYAQPGSFGLYIHIPFCARKCPYCDFNTYANLDALYERTVTALCAEMSAWGAKISGTVVTSVFVGGGTPTVLSGAQLTRLLDTVQTEFDLSRDCEITVEANPGTVDRDKFQLLNALGVNRLSMGVQSFQPDELSFLGRVHDVDDVYASYEAARAAGFDNINLDAMFGLPNQPLDSWEDSLTQAIALEPEHLSLYSLIVEPGTPLNQWVSSGRVEEPDEDHAGLQYEIAQARLATAGYSHYEVSNWAKTSESDKLDEGLSPYLACRHNLLYWRNGEYIGIGPGAHSHLRQQAEDGSTISLRWGNLKSVPDYVSAMQQRRSVEAFREEIATRESMGETMMLGLRLIREGVAFQRFLALYGVELDSVFRRELQALQAKGLLAVGDERVCLTNRGLMIGNQVFLEFLPNVAEDMAA